MALERRTTSYAITTPRWIAKDGSWLPTTQASADFGEPTFRWTNQTNILPVGYYSYSMAARTIDLSHAVEIISATITVDGDAGRFLAAAETIASSRCPDILVETASGLTNTFADYAGVTTGDLARFVGTGYTTSDANPAVFSGSAALDIGLFTGGVLQVRAGFDASLTPGTFPAPGGGTQVEGALFSGTVVIEVTYDVEVTVCVIPEPYTNPTPVCEEPYSLALMQGYALETWEGDAYDYVSNDWVAVANDGGGFDERALLWFDTCELSRLYTSIDAAYLRVSLDWLERYPCNPILYGYYVQPNQPDTNELQPVGAESPADYLLTEASSAIAPVEMWSLGLGLMTLDSEDESDDGSTSYFYGPATATFELDNLTMLDGRVTGIVLAGGYTNGLGRIDLAITNAELLICGVEAPPDTDGDGVPDPDDPDPNDPNVPGDTPPDRNRPDPDRDRRRGERVIAYREEYPIPFEQPAPTKIEAMRRFLLRLRRDG